MKIGVVGAGNIGHTIGKKWAAAGHQVMFGVRDVRHPRMKALAEEGGGHISVGNTAEAVAFGEVILIAIPGKAVAEMAAAFKAGLEGKLLIDATNKVGDAVMNSVADLAEQVPRARIFRAFNSLGWENFEQTRLGHQQVDLFFCGPGGADRQIMEQLIADVGLRPVYIGDLGQLNTVDNMTRLWFALAMGQGYGRRLAFKVLTE